MMFRVGWKKEIESAADWSFSHIENKLASMWVTPLVDHTISEFTPISDQRQLNSCVGNSTTDALEILIGLEQGQAAPQLSRLMTYWLARHLDGTDQKDEGAQIRSAFTQLAKFGVCLEAEWPYEEIKVLTQPSVKAFETGNSNKITAFYRIGTTRAKRLSDIETAIRANHPVVFGTIVGSDFMEWRKGEPALSRETRPEGGHAIICTGIRFNRKTRLMEYLIRNSWGADWGDNGHIWLTSEYMASDDTSDLWVPTRVPELVL